jgi:hypothetical protein
MARQVTITLDDDVAALIEAPVVIATFAASPDWA